MSTLWKKFPRKPPKEETNDGNPSGPDMYQTETPVQQEIPRPQDSMYELQQRLQQHERTIYEQGRTIETQRRNMASMQEEEKVLQSQVWTYSDQLSLSKGEADILREQIRMLDEDIRSLRRQVQDSDARISVLNGSCQGKEQELATKSNEMQVLGGHNQELQRRVADLEILIANSTSDTGTDLQSFFDHYSELKVAHDEMTSKLKSKEETCLNLHQTLQTTESEKASLRAVVASLQKEVSCLEISQPKTLRSLLILRLAEQASIVEIADDGVNTDDQVKNWLPAGLLNNSLDKICSPAEVQSFCSLLPKGRACKRFFDPLRLDFCSMCSRAKFRFSLDAGSHSVKWLNEYLGKTRYFSCCHELVCKECFKKHLLDTLASKWWYKLGTLQWFPCPRDGCGEALGIRCEADLQICLERYCDTDAEEHVEMYVKVLAFRQALDTLDPKPSDDVLQKATELHQQLVTTNRMYSLFDHRFDPELVDETGCIPEFKPGTIFNCVMDNVPSPVPLFLKFLRRQRKSKSCMVCSKTMFDIDYGGVEAWKAACGDFKGSWMWNILVFPTSEIQRCDHDLEVCRMCTAKHIRSSLVSGGPSACENLSCPQCSKKLCYQEVHELADAETSARYEKFLLQRYLSSDPNFRWCLSPLCENGQLYQRSPRNPKTSCEVCNFEMCFTHETPWHEGLTCDEYESQRDHGDPNFAETQEWIRSNTKPCPGCQVGIQKGKACFHMTCSQCNHQFCWQCLANWEQIRTQGQDGHADGCFFRTNDVRPTQLRGENIDDAIRARNG